MMKEWKKERGVLLRAAIYFHGQVAVDIALPMRRKRRRTQIMMKERKMERSVLLRAAINFHRRVTMDIARPMRCKSSWTQ